ncbi:MAG TPA: tetratricopeptide repeat protein [Thermoanaerobaculia bacterium]|nr:tetratricopeptide repeat protein [Thermoanaerobaculia bacterium]
MFRNLSRSRKLIVLGTLLSLVFAYPSVSEAQKNKKKKKPPAQQGGGDQGGQQGGGQNPPAQEPPPSEVYTVDRQLWEHKTGEARGTIVKVADKAGSNGAVALAMGRVLEQEKKYGESESHLRKATELSPSDPAAFVYLGETLLRARKGGDADSAFRKAEELGRSAGGKEGEYYRGVALQRLRRFDEAVEALEKARQADGGNARIPYQIGVTRVFQEQWQPALDQLNKAIEMDSGLAYAYFYRGLAAEKAGRKDLLVNDMERFLALAPSSPEAERAKAILRAAKR